MEEIQKRQQNQLSKVGNNSKLQRLKTARETAPAVREYQDYDELENLLIYLFVLTGLNKDRYPSKIEKDFLLSYIRNTYGSWTLEEIKIAFELAVERKLTPFFQEGDKLSHFQSFSAPWFNGIITAYKEYRIELKTQMRTKSDFKEGELSPYPNLSTEQYFELFLFSKYDDYFETGEYNFTKLDYDALFRRLFLLGLIKLTKGEVKEIKDRITKQKKFKPSVPDHIREVRIDSDCRAYCVKNWINENVENLISADQLKEIVTTKIKQNEKAN